MFTFIYCFDENYNIQGFVSIMSLLDKVSEKINIVIVHKQKEKFSKYEKLISNHNRLESLEIKEINTKDIEFPNVNNNHVSEATYYRMYLDQIQFDNTFSKCIYLDADIICLNNPINYFQEIYTKLKEQGKPLAARTDYIKFKDEQHEDDVFIRNKLTSINYFNAGVLLFDYQNWIENGYFKELRNIQKNYDGTINFWDQDLLNVLIDGNYLEMNHFSNFHIAADWNYPAHITESHAIFLHYQGKPKPWHISFINDSSTQFFQENYRKLFGKKVFVTKSTFSRDLKGFLKLIFSLQILKCSYPLSTLKEALKALFFSSSINQ